MLQRMRYMAQQTIPFPRCVAAVNFLLKCCALKGTK